MKIALDPYMLRDRPFARSAASRRRSAIVTSSCRRARTSSHSSSIPARTALAWWSSGLHSARPGWSCRPYCRCAAGRARTRTPRQAAVRFWKPAIHLTVELGCPLMNSQFNGRPDRSADSEAAFWRSLEDLLPIFMCEGMALNLEALPDHFIERNDSAVDLIRGIDSPNVRYVYGAPHTFHLGDGVAAMIRRAAPVLAQVHLADGLDHRASSGLRYIVNSPGCSVRVHQHLSIDEGEVDFEALFAGLAEIGFDGTLTTCVFAWEKRAEDSARVNLERIRSYLAASSTAAPT